MKIYILSLIASATLMANQGMSSDCVQCCSLPQGLMPAGVRLDCGWDLYTDAGFIYWQPMQDDMGFALKSDLADIPGFSSSGSFFAPPANGIAFNGKMIEMAQVFKPGFTVGIGLNSDHDSWNACLHYTQFVSRQTVNESIDATGTVTLLPAKDIPETLFNLPLAFPLGFSSVASKWDLSLNIVDLELGRGTWIGRKFSVRPFFGLRGAWIRQKWKNEWVSQYSTQNIFNYPAQHASLDDFRRSSSWGLGIRAGVDGDYVIWRGLRFYGNAAADILFTRYTKLTTKISGTNFVTARTIFARHEEDDLNAVRPHFETEFGFGWGSYFQQKRYHLDLSVGYTFQVFFDQNMFRNYFEDFNIQGLSMHPNADLFINGLTAAARFDF